MDVTHDYINMLKKMYTTPLWALLIFSTLFLVSSKGALLKRPAEGTLNEAAHNFLLILVNAIIAAFVFGNLSFLSNILFETLSLPHLTTELWNSIPYALTFIIALFALDFQNYWAHRLLHTKYLWSLHALHHSDAFMTWTTSYRIHIFEWVVMSFVYVTLLGWLFFPPEIVAVIGVIRGWHSKLIHCQLGWSFGRFRKLIASPNYHRWHHSVAPETYGKNLCDMFPLWDILFGTHYDPGHCDTDIGITDGPEGFLQGQLYPFQYSYKAIRKRLTARKAIPSQIP